MKKILTLMSLGLLVAGAAFAGVDGDRLFVQPNATFSGATVIGATTVGTVTQPSYAVGLTTGPSTTNNDDSCDIAVMPAATLLVPYFEVDFENPASNALNTIFSITNTTPQPQIAHVTIWTDWSFPVIDFNLWLTGYDVVPVSLYDIIRNGTIPVTGYRVSPIGALSYDIPSTSSGVKGTGGSGTTTDTLRYPFGITGNPNMVQGVVGGVQDPLSGCGTLPGPIPSQLVTAIQDALTVGTYPGCSGRIGGQNDVATGYITIDVANKCSQLLPSDPDFFTNDILWDNSLIGDYMLLNSSTTTGNWAGGTPMVHIRAIPEGGPAANPILGTPAFGAGSRAAAILTPTNFPFTFYDRYTQDLVNNEIDRRQPLPGVFAARFIQDVPTGPTGFDTRLIVWREGDLEGEGSCAAIAGTGGLSIFGILNSDIPAARGVRFDEQENPNISTGCQISPCPGESQFAFDESQAVTTRDSGYFPPDFASTADLGGWMYLNLNGANPTGDRINDESQNWVAINMTAEGRYGVLYDAAVLQNGCTPNPEAEGGIIRPGPNFVPAVVVGTGD